jgi:PAS domain S-box-containing protein
LLALVPVIGVQLYNEHQLSQLRQAEVHEQALRLARESAAEIERTIEGVKELLFTVAELPVVRDEDGAACSAFFSKLREHYAEYLVIGAADSQGVPYCSSTRPNAVPSVSERDYFQRVMTTGAFSVGEFRVGRVSGRKLIGLAYPVHGEDGRVVAAVLAGIDLTWLAQHLAERSLPPHTSFAVTDRNGTFLVRVPNSESWIGRAVPENLRYLTHIKTPQVSEETDADGVRRIGAAVPVSFSDQTDLVVTVGLSEDVAVAGVRAATRAELLMMGLAVLVTVGLIILGGQRLVRKPLEQLAVAARRWQQGDYAARVGLRQQSRELVGLVGSLEAMATTLGARETALRDSEQRFRRVFEQSPLGKATAGPDFRFREVNPALCGMSGYTADELSGMSFLDLLHPDDRAAFSLHCTAVMIGEMEQFRLEARLVRKPGEAVWVNVNVVPLRDMEGRPVACFAIVEDIDERTHLAQALRQLNETLEQQVEDRARQLTASRARLRAFFEISPDWLTLQRVTPDGRAVYEDMNKTCEEAYGKSRDEVIGRTVEEVLGAEAAVIPMRLLRECVRTARPQRYLAERTLSGRTRTIDVMFVLVPDASEGDDRFVITTARDVTDREKIEERLRQSQKLEALGRLTGGVAHDVNNLLAIIRGSVELLDLRNGANYRQAVDNVLNATDRAAGLTRQLLAFSRDHALKPEVLDLRQRLPRLGSLISPSLRGDITVETDVVGDLWRVKIDPGELELALLNIAINARDAMPAGGKLTISARNVALGPGTDRQTGLGGDFVVLAVQDTGYGMSSDIAAQAFEPFYTTKAVGQGTGLGLSQVYGFARQSGGAATIDSQPGKGTTVTLYFPATTEPLEIDADEVVAAPVERSARILLVEDTDEVAQVTAGLLREFGYDVLRARDGNAALALIEAAPADIDLVLTDLVMPGGLSGLQLARQLRERYAALPIVMTTGYSAAAQEAEREGYEIVRKPYDFRELRKAVAAKLGRRSTSPVRRR